MPSEDKPQKKRHYISADEFSHSLGITRDLLGGVKEQDVADIMGVNIQSIRAWRRGRTKCSKTIRWALYGLCALVMAQQTGINPLDKETWPSKGESS